jgi:tRNA nucleotidyltransferase (CCA-adding enzyme)
MHIPLTIYEKKILEKIAKAAQGLHVESYVIGGFVRDILLDRNHKKDIDIVAVGSGIELAIKVSELLPNHPKVQVFKNYGTAMLRYKEMDIEFVGARKESYTNDSRNPLVEIGTLKDDQERRDFTINAMAFSLNSDNFGDLVDPFNGVSDLENKILKTPLHPDITYSDDPLRMMRAIRFASQLHFLIESESLEAITKNATRISIISNNKSSYSLVTLRKLPSLLPSKKLSRLSGSSCTAQYATVGYAISKKSLISW